MVFNVNAKLELGARLVNMRYELRLTASLAGSQGALVSKPLPHFDIRFLKYERRPALKHFAKRRLSCPERELAKSRTTKPSIFCAKCPWTGKLWNYRAASPVARNLQDLTQRRSGGKAAEGTRQTFGRSGVRYEPEILRRSELVHHFCRLHKD